MNSERIPRSLLRGLARELQTIKLYLAWKVPCIDSTELAEVLVQGASKKSMLRRAISFTQLKTIGDPCFIRIIGDSISIRACFSWRNIKQRKDRIKKKDDTRIPSYWYLRSFDKGSNLGPRLEELFQSYIRKALIEPLDI